MRLRLPLKPGDDLDKSVELDGMQDRFDPDALPALELADARVTARLRGRQAAVEYVATIRNKGDFPLEAALDFWLPDDAAVRGGCRRAPSPGGGAGPPAPRAAGGAGPGEQPLRLLIDTRLPVRPEGMAFTWLPPTG
ncbi:MAG: hypothetical protein R3F43_10565 [bacterium]